MTKADGNLPIRRGFPRNGLPANTARRHFFVGPATDDDLDDAPVWCAAGGVALYPSSCVVCGYKRGYNAAVMSKARWKCAALYLQERYSISL